MNKIYATFLFLYIISSVFQFGSVELRVHFLDVGQGDSILVQMPGGYDVLIDGGEGSEVLVEIGKLLPPWDRCIDLMVLTHPHLDHLGGLIEVMDRYEVKEVWLNPIGHKIPEFLILIDRIHSDINNIEIVFPIKGYLKKYRNLSINVVWPQSKSIYRDFVGFSKYMKSEDEILSQNHSFSGCEVNNSSIVILLSYGNVDILLTGDAEIEVEEQISIGLSKNRPIEVLKAGHHCSRTASSEKLLSNIDAKIAICSYGEENKFGHPHEETLERFDRYGIEYYSTAGNGTITIKTDGNNWEMVEK